MSGGQGLLQVCKRHCLSYFSVGKMADNLREKGPIPHTGVVDYGRKSERRELEAAGRIAVKRWREMSACIQTATSRL